MFQYPFSINILTDYETWRDNKLAAYPIAVEKNIIEIKNASHPTPDELQSLKKLCQKHNFALYRFTNRDIGSKALVHNLAKQLGLIHLDNNLCVDADGLTSIQVTTHTGQHDYIPYTNKPLSWHTDGYYNAPHEQIRGMLLHCAQPAISGGESLLMDHEIAYILLREANPAYIAALMHPQAFTIPTNELNGQIIRAAQTGPVFSLDSVGNLHMRYSARQKNVIWRDDALTQEAAAFLLKLWQEDSPYKIRYTLKAGEGLICNNVLHCRTAFTDAEDPEQKRLLYRGRYYERVAS